MTRPSRRLLAPIGLVALSLLSCGREVTGPDDGVVIGRARQAALRIEAQFPTLPGHADAASDVAPFVDVRVTVTALDGRTLFDRTIPFPSTADSLELPATFPLPLSAPDTGISVSLRLAYINAAGDTVFRGGPIITRARPVGAPGANSPTTAPIFYSGVGANAASVELTPPTGLAVAGSSTAFTAVARDGQGNVIANTPVFFSSGDTSRATVANPALLSATWRARRGPATVIATLLNGPADTATFTISLPASQLLVVSGNAQTAVAGSALAQPLVLRVAASDSIGVAGVPVTFAVTAGGGTLGALSDTSDANGLVSTTWTLGALGAQAVTATATGIAGATRVLNATATAGPAARLQMVTQPNSTVAGAPITTSVRAVDALGNLAAAFTGAVDVVVDSGPIEGWSLGGTDTVAAVGGVAAFTTLSLDVASQYRFRFRAAGLDSVVSAPFTIGAAAPAALAPYAGLGQSGLVSTPLADSLAVRVADAFGNPVAGITVTWAVTLGGGTVSPTTRVTGADGVARTAWTLGNVVGAQTAQATALALPAATFAATGVAAVSGARWLGTVNSDWNTAANWQAGVVPGLVDTVLIAAGAPNIARLGSNTVIGALEVESGASLDLDTLGLAVGGSILVNTGGSIVAQPTGALAMVASGNLRGNVPNLQLSGATVTVTGPTTVNGLLAVGNGMLALNGQSVTVVGDFATTGTGSFQMNPGSALSVSGDVVLAGGSTSGLLTGGVLTVAGDFTQGGGSASAFDASGSHVVHFAGPTRQTVLLLNADAALSAGCAGSCFANLTTAPGTGSSALAFNSNAKVRGRMQIAADTLVAAGRTLLSDSASVTSAAVTLGALGWRRDFTRGAGFAADSLIAWGTGALILSENIRTVVRGAYTAAASHLADLVVDAGGILDVAGVAAVSGTLAVRNNGRVLMQEDSDSLTVGGAATFDGDPPVGSLTGGALVIGGNFTQLGTGRAFVSELTHRVRLTGNTVSISVADPVDNRFNHLFLQGVSAVTINTPISIDGQVTLGPSVSVVGGPAVVTLAGTVVDPVGGRWQVNSTIFTGGDPVLPSSLQSNLTFIFGVQLDANLTVTGDVAVHGGALDLNGHRLDVNGSFSTALAGGLRMQNAADTLYVSGNAEFGGASSVGQIITGHLAIGGNFRQVGAPTTFSADAPHETWFVGTTPQSIEFANPGFGAGSSHFGTFYLGQGGAQSTVLLSDVFVGGQLETGVVAGPSHVISGAGFRVRARGADIDRLTFNNIRLRVEDGAALVALDTLQFDAMDPTVVQLEIVRGTGTVNIARLGFAVTPTTGQYLRVEDPDGLAGGAFVVNITQPTPSVPGGFLQVIPPAVVNGWNPAEFRWTGGGGSSLWTNAANWSDGVVPSPGDSVFVPAATLFAPVIPDGTTLRALVSARTETAITMAGGMTITERLHVPSTTGLSCGAGTVNVAGAATPVRMSGRVQCFMRMLSGTIDITDTLNVDANDLQVEGSAVLQPGTSVVRVGNNFSTLGGGRLRMQAAASRLLVVRGANFAGGGSASDLAAGRVEVGGNFSQSGNFTYFAAPGHVTRLFDADGGDAGTKQLGMNGINAQFGALEIDTWNRAVTTEVLVSETLTLLGNPSVGGPGSFVVASAVTAANPLAVMTLPAVRVGGALNFAGTWNVDTTVFTGTNQVISPSIAYQTVRVSGSGARMFGDDATFTIGGNLEVVGGSLRVGDGVGAVGVLVSGSLLVSGSGLLRMVDGLAEVSVAGNATFQGANTTGHLIDGVLSIGGNFVQGVNSQAFVATGAHVTRFAGSADASMSFANAGPALSRFATVDFDRPAGQTLTLTTAAHAANANLVGGNFTVAANTGAFTVTGTYQTSLLTLSVLGVNASFSAGSCSGLGVLQRLGLATVLGTGCLFNLP